MSLYGNILKRDPVFRYVYQRAVLEYQKEEADALWLKAGYRYEELIIAHKDEPLLAQFHGKTMIFKGIAIYGVLKKLHGDTAMKLMEAGMKDAAMERGKKMEYLLRKEWRRALFMRIQEFRFQVLCTEDAYYSRGDFTIGKTKRKLKTEIYSCPYYLFCKEEGCREMTHLFCDYEAMYYSKIDHIRFHRQECIGHGGKKCDFYFGRKD